LAAELKAFDRLRRQSFAGEADARAALEAFEKTLQLTPVYEGRAVRPPLPAKKRRPTGNEGTDPACYAIEGQLASRVDVHARQLLQKSRFVVATHDTEGAVLHDEPVLEAYRKDQQKVERGFRFLKDPLFMTATRFLKSPRRSMALMAIMTLCLTEEIVECYRDIDELLVLGGVIWGNNPADDYFVQSHGVKTPDAFWKVVVRGDGRAIARIVPNTKDAVEAKLDSYLVTVEAIEKRTGEMLPITGYARTTKPKGSWVVPIGRNKG
jgi:hypothetical protein